MEQFFPEGRRLIVFKVIFGSLFILLATFLGYRQVIQSEKYKEQERKQGQRRIVKPGPRGDVFDRNGNLLIGNKAHFSAKLHLESIEDEIWKKRKALRDKSISLQAVLKEENQLSIEKLLSFGFNDSLIKNRFIRLSGRTKKHDGQILRVKVFFQGQRIPVEQKESWFCH